MRLPAIAIALLCAFAEAASAQSAQDPMVFRRSELGSGVGIIIEGNGRITPQSAGELKKFVARMESGEWQVTEIWFNSVGGDLHTALEMGRFLRSERIETSVGQDGICLSACAYAFLGGVYRRLPPLETTQQRVLGFHQFAGDFSSSGVDTPAEASAVIGLISGQAQVTSSELAAYTTEMGVSVDLLRAASGAAGDEMVYPAESRLRELGVLFEFAEAWQFQLVADGTSLLAVGVHNDAFNRHQIGIGCFAADPGRLALVLTKPKGEYALDDYPAQFGDITKLKTARGDELKDKPDDYLMPNSDEVVEGLSAFVEDAKSGQPAAHETFGMSQLRFIADDRWYHLVVYPKLDFMTAAVEHGNFSIEVSFLNNMMDGYWISESRLTARQKDAVSAALRACQR
ncbi:MAG TPA: hypothetical protein VEA60_12395 [Allosphingosinicella sp.]|nr:hypothetical protein [Allosphingosinicella sp.]